jgi:flotillin
VIGFVRVEDVVRNSDYVCEQLGTKIEKDLAAIGLACLTVNLMNVSSESDYIEQLGFISHADLKKQVAIATAQARKDADVESAQASQQAAQLMSQASQKRAQAEFEAKVRTEELNHQFELTKLRLQAQILAEQAKEVPSLSGEGRSENMPAHGQKTGLLVDVP